MNVLVDTSIWSLALRRERLAADPRVHELEMLIRENRATILGPIRQELLSGIREKPQYDRLRRHLRAFPDIALRSGDYERAASFFNQCRARGIQGSNTDFLICAVASRRKLAIFTSDDDFGRFASALPIRLHARNPA